MRTNFVIMIIFFLQCFDLSLLHVMLHCLKKNVCLNLHLLTSNDLIQCTGSSKDHFFTVGMPFFFSFWFIYIQFYYYFYQYCIQDFKCSMFSHTCNAKPDFNMLNNFLNLKQILRANIYALFNNKAKLKQSSYLQLKDP